MRYFIELSYRGTAYCGWQPQTVGVSIQSTLEAAISQRLGRRVYVVGSGRTDAGVHARQQFAHFDTDEQLDVSEAWLYSLNCLLPEDMAIRSVFPVRETDHARFSAIFRYYQYHVTRQKDVFSYGLTYHFRPWLNETLMNEACQRMLNHTNFQSFSKARANVNHFHCRLDFAYWERINDDHLTFHIRADRFLWGMVRTIVGTMLEIGQERMDIHQFEQVIQAKDRNAAGRAVPANGLYLTEVGYPEAVMSGRDKGAGP